MLRQPKREAISVTVCEKIHHTVSIQIHQDRAISVIFSPSPIIDA